MHTQVQAYQLRDRQKFVIILKFNFFKTCMIPICEGLRIVLITLSLQTASITAEVEANQVSLSQDNNSDPVYLATL